MLVMRRRAGESFLVGGEIEIQVLQVTGTRVKLGISAPASMPIVRREIQITGDENQIAARCLDVGAISALLQSLPLNPVSPMPAVECQVLDDIQDQAEPAK